MSKSQAPPLSYNYGQILVLVFSPASLIRWLLIQRWHNKEKYYLPVPDRIQRFVTQTSGVVLLKFKLHRSSKNQCCSDSVLVGYELRTLLCVQPLWPLCSGLCRSQCPGSTANIIFFYPSSLTPNNLIKQVLCFPSAFETYLQWAGIEPGSSCYASNCSNHQTIHWTS